MRGFSLHGQSRAGAPADQNMGGARAVVTGGALGIGGAAARRLASEGARVLIADINDEAAQQNIDRIAAAGGVAKSIHTDVASSSDIAAMIQAAVDEWDRLDILVQNAFSVLGGESRIHGTAESVEEADWDWGMDVLAKALYLGTKHAVPHMRKSGGGSIVNLASVHSVLQEAEMLVYEAGKAAVVGMTRCAALEYAAKGVNVNAICPGLVDTDMLSTLQTSAAALGVELEEMQKMVLSRVPMGRFLAPEEIAHIAVYLGSSESDGMTGQTITISGGMRMG